MFVVDLLRPRILVELGTHGGDSYCAFCQAVRELNLDTRCYAVDTWRGDPQTGFYGPEVLADLRAWHDPLYGTFSRLVPSSFEEALPHFADRTIDLLHIDGVHRHEDVRRDFDSWLPKLSERGVVLFHDINVREGDFGVSALWDEIKTQYPHFEFLHGHGLGVLGVGKEQPAGLQRLYQSPPEDAASTRNLFFSLGHRLTLLVEQRRLNDATRRLAHWEHTSAALEGRLAEREQAEEALRLRVAELERESTALRRQTAERERAAESLHRHLTELERSREEARREQRAWEARASEARARLGEAMQRQEETARRLAHWESHARALSTELAALQGRRILQFLERFRPGPDLSRHISPAFQDLLDDSYLFLGDLRGYRLQPSEDLRIPRAYTLVLDRPNLSGLVLAPIIDLPEASGSLGIELATPDGAVIASARVSLSAIEHGRPVRLLFPPVPPSARTVVLRVSLRDATAPARLFEWRRRRFLGLGPPATRPFCAFVFA